MSDFLFGSTQVKSGNGSASWLYTSKFVCGQNGDATEIQIYSDSSGEAKVALYTDNAGIPDALIVKNDSGTAVTGGQWNAISISSTTVTAGTTYWIAAMGNASGVITNKSGVATSKYDFPYNYGTFTFPGTFPSTSDIGVEFLFAVYGSREVENYEDDLGTISGSGVFGNIDGVFTDFVRPLNPRSRAHSSEILYGCIFADNFSSRSLIDKNNGAILNGDDLDFNSKNGLISGGIGKISYSAISIVSNSIVMSFRITSGGILTASADLTEGVPSDGWCIWVDGDGVHANNSDGAIIATECFIAGDFLDYEYHVVTYIIDLDNNIHILYVDNENSGEQSTLISDPIAASASIFVAGFSSNNIIGNISGLRIYNKILTESDHNAYAS